MKKRHRNRISQFGLSWQIWYRPIYLSVAFSHGDERSLLLDPKTYSGMLANPLKYSEFERFEQALCSSIDVSAMRFPAPLIERAPRLPRERLAGSMAQANGSTREQKRQLTPAW
ncbi:hypothetical protein M493_01835 [Geobacillus genomosp. 3]|uniref:Uncharacterized protein n=1 Tax=Geobacillus genomosp. 3 TaxID=1921421 RepID=S5ZK59_GEOG3|nr:hypothetical protein M493_01835 [Geobacillus genomosp. 3]